jgi:hypothetical protein
MILRIACFLALVFSAQLQATTLSGELTGNDIKSINSLMLYPSIHRSWTAHALAPEGPLGFELGLETAFVFRRDLMGLGDGRGVAPRIIPVPRLWTSVELPLNIKLSGSAGLGGLFNGIQTYGVGTQWAFYKDPSKDTSFSLDFRYTHVNVFGDLKGNVMGLSAQATKDLLVWQPYAGVGFVVANGTADDSLMKEGEDSGPYTTATYHLFVGVRIDLIAKLAIQLDVMGDRPSMGVLLERSF